MSVTLLREAPFDVVVEQAERLFAEIATDNEKSITGPLALEGYDTAALASNLRKSIDNLEAAGARQSAHIGASQRVGTTMTVAVDAAAAYVRSVEKRGAVLAKTGVPLGIALGDVFRARPVTPGKAPWKEIEGQLVRIRHQFAATPGDVPGFPAAFRARAATLQMAARQELHGDEGVETKVEDATNDLLAAREAVITACLDYLDLLEIVNGDREAQALPPLPGGNLEVVRGWAATRPGDVAERTAAAQPAAGV